MDEIKAHAAAASAVATLRRCETIRERCAAITAAVDAGRSAHFRLDRSRLADVADRVATLTRSRFPDLRIPYHSRWRHFEAGGIDRKAELDAKLAGRTQVAVARARIDLALVSVLLDAGAGPQWRYVESGRVYTRSEGLGVASLRAFMAGTFSSDAGDPCRVDAKGLLRIDTTGLAQAFQVDADNPLVGLDGRAALLRRLGQALREQPQMFTSEGQPGHLFDALTHHRHAPAIHGHRPLPVAQHHQVSAARILQALHDAFSSIWPSGQHLDAARELPLGDVWRHPHAGGAGLDAGWVPFHKLSQWLAYSLIEPFEWAGVTVTGLDALTGLPEYRNGGLLLDAGVIVPLADDFARRHWQPADEAIVEWRALTVALIDELAPLVRHRLGVTPEQMPLACVLEGGTWGAGREIAKELRSDGGPPLAIASDGTVF